MMHTAVGAWTQLGDGRPSEAAVGGPIAAVEDENNQLLLLPIACCCTFFLEPYPEGSRKIAKDS